MKKQTKIIFALITPILVLSGVAAGLYFHLADREVPLSNYVQVYETRGTKAKLLARQVDLKWEDYSFSGNNEINVNQATTHNELDGLGVAMTHASAYVLQTSDTATKNEALQTLFGKDGANLNVVRIPIGTSDYTYTDHFYTLNDLEEGTKDYDLEHFSLTKDEQYLIPTLQEITAINPEVKFVGAPWSAPAWMKANENLIGGSIIGHSGNTTSREEEAFGKYLVKFVESYGDAGIPIHYLSLLNEPNIANVQYPSMQMGVNQYMRIALIVTTELANKGLKTKIMAYDHNVGSASDLTVFNMFSDEIMNNKALNPYFSGFAFHAYGAEWSTLYPNILADNLTNYPKFGNYITEITESVASLDFATNLSWSTANVTIGPFSHGSAMALYWNAALDEGGQPVLGNAAICYGMLTIKDGVIIKNAAYYSFAHVSKFAYALNGQQPIRIDSYSDNPAKIKAVAYKRGDGALVVAVTNNDATTYEDVDLVLGGKMVTYRVQPESLVTFVALPEDQHIPSPEAINFSKVRVVQKTINQFELIVNLAQAYADVKYYIGTTEHFSAATSVNSYRDNEGADHLSAALVPGDNYLWAAAGEKRAMLPLTIPQMNPTIVIENEVATIAFNLDQQTSWSSFCDPYGKAIYRSHKTVFDEEAEQVNVTKTGQVDPIYILTDSYVDHDYEEAKPYYFCVMVGKNGLTTYIAYPVAVGATLFLEPQLTLALVEGLPTLNVTATISGNNVAQDFHLVIKALSGESHGVVNQSMDALLFVFDCRQLTLPGVWYDVVILHTLTGVMYDLTDEYAVLNNISYGNKRFNFQSWQGIIKLNMNLLNYTQVDADLTNEGTTPYLVVNGQMANSALAVLRITYWDVDHSVTVINSPNLALSAGAFSFKVDLSLLAIAGTYYDIVLLIDEEASALTSNDAININKTLDSENRHYYFRSWQGLLKVAFSEGGS